MASDLHHTAAVVYDLNGREAAEAGLILDALPEIEQYIFCSSAGVYKKSDEMPHREIDEGDPKSRHKVKIHMCQISLGGICMLGWHFAGMMKFLLDCIDALSFPGIFPCMDDVTALDEREWIRKPFQAMHLHHRIRRVISSPTDDRYWL